MSLTIDVHEHIFNGKDIPLLGYLQSRGRYEFKTRQGACLMPALAKSIRYRMEHGGEGGWGRSLGGKILRATISALMGKGYAAWADTLSKPLPEIIEEMIETYPPADVDLIIPLMIDYDYWFLDSTDTPIAKQINDVASLAVEPSRGLIHPFVPFCPAREVAYRRHLADPNDPAGWAPDNRPEEVGSLALVKEAIQSKGFIGVKLYPTIGFRPIDNGSVPQELRRKIPYRKQNNRYFSHTGQEYDDVLAELYDFCIQEEVPITAHCVMDGIEAFKHASEVFGHPDFWEQVLTTPRFKGLKVCLAHFGWADKAKWGDTDTWTAVIAEKMKDFDTLYTDVAHHRVMEAGNRKRFVDYYNKLLEGREYVLDRLMFGIDWPLIKREKDYHYFKASYLRALSDIRFNGNRKVSTEQMEGFLGGNAVKFLGLAPGGKNHTRLAEYYDTHNITPPTWFLNLASQPSPRPSPSPTPIP